MNLNRNQRFHFFISFLLLINQTAGSLPAFAQSEIDLAQQAPEASKSADSPLTPVATEPQQAPQSLSEPSPLSAVDDYSEDQEQSEAETDRNSLEYNLALLKQSTEDGLPVAFVVDDLDAEQLKSLVEDEGNPEVLIVSFVTDGNVKSLLYSSGSETDVRVNNLVDDLLDTLAAENDVRFAHTHVDPLSNGPSLLDIKSAQKTEAVITSSGSYLYGGGISVPKPLDYSGAINWLNSVNVNTNETVVTDSVQALIAAVDSLRADSDSIPNRADALLQAFRDSDLTTDTRINIPAVYTSPSVITADTATKIDSGAYTDSFSVSVLSSARVRVSYSGLDTEPEQAGVTIHNTNGSLINHSDPDRLVFKLSSSEAGSDLKIVITQIGTGAYDIVNIAGIAVKDGTYALDLGQLGFDPATIDSISFIRDSAMTPGGSGYFDVVLPSQSRYGFNSSLPDSTKGSGDVTLLPRGAQASSFADTILGASSVLANQSSLGATVTYSGLNLGNGSAGMIWQYGATGKDFSKRKIIDLALEGTAAGARFEIEDINGHKASITLTGIAADAFHSYVIDLNDPAIAGQGVDLSKIRSVKVVTNQTLAGNGNGTLQVALGQITTDTPLTGTTTRVTEKETGVFEIKVYQIDPTRSDLHGKLLSHTLQANKGASTYEITTIEVLADGTDTGKWLSVRQQKQLAASTYEIKTFQVVNGQSKGSLQNWFVQETKSDGSTAITEIQSSSTAHQITEQKKLSNTALEIWTYAADFTDVENHLTAGSTTTSSVTSTDKLSSTLHYDGLNLNDSNIYASTSWVYPESVWATGANLSNMTFHFSLKGTAQKAWIAFQDVDGKVSWIPIDGISSTEFKDFSLSLSDPTLTADIDITKVRQINFLVNGVDAEMTTGTLDVKIAEMPVSNKDGIRGALLSHKVQQDLGDGTFRIVDYKLENGVSTAEQTSVVDQKQLNATAVDIKTYHPVNDPIVTFASQNFEGSFPPADYTTSGDASWVKDTTTFHDGSAAAASGPITDSGRSVIQRTYNVTEASELSFYWKVSSETNFDYFYVCVDQTPCSKSTALSSISGEVAWAQYKTNLGVGQHTVTWVYEKDTSDSSGSDKAWLDGVLLTSAPVSTLEPLSHIVQEDLGSGSTRVTTYKVENGVSTTEVVSIVEQTPIDALNLDVKTYAINTDGSKGALETHLIQTLIDSDGIRTTGYDPVTNAVTSIVEQTAFQDGVLEVRTFNIKADGTKGTLASDVVHGDVGNGVHRIVTYKIENGDATDQVTSVVDETTFSGGIIGIDSFLPVTEPGTILTSQGFEGTFPPSGYTTTGNALWLKDTSVFHDGNAAATSGDVDDGGWSVFQSSFTADQAGVLSFFWKVSSELNYDFIYLCVDQTNCTQTVAETAISGEVDWTQYTVDLTAGPHTLTWVYEKDSADSAGSDRAWVDGVQFTTNPVTNLVLQSYVEQEPLASGGYRVTSFKLQDGNPTSEILSTEDRLQPAVNNSFGDVYTPFNPPAAIRTSQVSSPVQPAQIVTQAGSTNAVDPGLRYDPDDGSPVTPDEPDPADENDTSLEDLLKNAQDDFKGGGAAGESSSSSISASENLAVTNFSSRRSAPSHKGGGSVSFGGYTVGSDTTIAAPKQQTPITQNTTEKPKKEEPNDLYLTGDPIQDSLLFFLATTDEQAKFEKEHFKEAQDIKNHEKETVDKAKRKEQEVKKQKKRDKKSILGNFQKAFEKVFQRKSRSHSDPLQRNARSFSQPRTARTSPMSAAKKG